MGTVVMETGTLVALTSLGPASSIRLRSSMMPHSSMRSRTAEPSGAMRVCTRLRALFHMGEKPFRAGHSATGLSGSPLAATSHMITPQRSGRSSSLPLAAAIIAATLTCCTCTRTERNDGGGGRTRVEVADGSGASPGVGLGTAGSEVDAIRLEAWAKAERDATDGSVLINLHEGCDCARANAPGALGVVASVVEGTVSSDGAPTAVSAAGGSTAGAAPSGRVCSSCVSGIAFTQSYRRKLPFLTFLRMVRNIILYSCKGEQILHEDCFYRN